MLCPIFQIPWGGDLNSPVDNVASKCCTLSTRSKNTHCWWSYDDHDNDHSEWWKCCIKMMHSVCSIHNYTLLLHFSAFRMMIKIMMMRRIMMIMIMQYEWWRWWWWVASRRLTNALQYIIWERTQRRFSISRLWSSGQSLNVMLQTFITWVTRQWGQTTEKLIIQDSQKKCILIL